MRNTTCICSHFYMEPELFQDRDLYGPAIDIWSYGCIFADIAIGNPFFIGQDNVSSRSHVCSARSPRLTLAQCLQCLKKQMWDVTFPTVHQNRGLGRSQSCCLRVDGCRLASAQRMRTCLMGYCNGRQGSACTARGSSRTHSLTSSRHHLAAERSFRCRSSTSHWKGSLLLVACRRPIDWTCNQSNKYI